MLGAILSIVVSGFIIGALARWAVPGPDPMSIWLTIAIGVGGSLIGGGIAAAVVGADQTSGDIFTTLLASVIAATLLVIAYRRFVQKRPITGPGAYRPPAGRGGGRSLFGSPAKRAYEREDTAEQIRKLAELRDSGAITPEEFEAKKAELLARL
jgi:uncharacterized membrane protein YeaQ/YmgE (transglycosylase-associated protein family)